ncbi:MAG: dhmA 1 [Deinococcus sp.]|nr:dhmA 1 [Deinococcus sp.]
MTQTTFTRAGLQFSVTERGPTHAEPVLLLHGFPQTATSWSRVAEGLAAAGFRTLALDQRGYSPGARPPGRRAYRLEELMADAAALIEAYASGPAHVVGHDWGAVVAWMLAVHRPEVVQTVTGLSVPHPGAYARALVSSRQALLSWYILAFQLPVLPEWLLSRPGMLENSLRRSGQSSVAARRDAAALAGALTGPINWYRAPPLPLRSAQGGMIRRPSLLVWGDADPFVSRSAIDHHAAFVQGRSRTEVLAGAGHWLPDQVPGRVTQLILEHIHGA